MSDTKTNRTYAWALQTDYATQKAIAAAAYKQLIVTDENTLEYQPRLNNNEDWSHGVNSPTEEWLEAHDVRVSHTIPGFAQELGKIFFLNMGDTVTTPSGGTVSRKHTFVPTDPAVTRQDKAVSYVEKVGAGWHKLMPSGVSDGFVLKGEGSGILTCDLSLVGSGKVVNNPAVTYPPTATPTVTNLSNLYKFYNTQVGITPNDGGSYTAPYACRYRSFEVAFKKTLLEEAGFKPGCANFLVPGNPNSGMIRSALEFDKQMLDFSFNVDMAAGTPEFEAVQDNRPINLTIAATGGIIEGAIPFELKVLISIAKYRTTKPVLVDGIWQFAIQGQAFFNTATNRLFQIELTNDVADYSAAF
ncbi:MAG: hypothetical protein KIS76_03835 [Pyrinomonadaceae bacterium]|nr:hypothetical protein [Pyrinomonadaceae bacterium]